MEFFLSSFVLITFLIAANIVVMSEDGWTTFEEIFGVVFRILGIFFYLYLLCSAAYTVLGVFFKK